MKMLLLKIHAARSDSRDVKHAEFDMISNRRHGVKGRRPTLRFDA
jgi:hypothetical protein